MGNEITVFVWPHIKIAEGMGREGARAVVTEWTMSYRKEEARRAEQRSSESKQALRNAMLAVEARKSWRECLEGEKYTLYRVA